MDKLLIEGGRPLEGSVRISGAKNAALPAMAAALLTSDRVELTNVPHVRDIITMGKLLAHMGAIVETPELPPTSMTIQAEQVNGAEAPYELVRTMRASILTLGPLVARTGSARVSLPGGCAIGARPVDLHLKALEQMGAEIGTSHGYVEARVPGGGRLPGGSVFFDKITVTGTENVLMAAALAEGETQIGNAAQEPEITDLADLLIKMGAEIEGAGTSTIRVRGKEQLYGATHRVIPDRIEAGTFLVAGAITNGSLELTYCEPEHLRSIIAKLRETGVEIRETAPGTLSVRGARKLIQQLYASRLGCLASRWGAVTSCRRFEMRQERGRFLHPSDSTLIRGTSQSPFKTHLRLSTPMTTYRSSTMLRQSVPWAVRSRIR